MSGDGPVVDDSPATRFLCLHQPKRFLSTEEGAGQIYVDDGLPLFDRHVFERRSRRSQPGVVEQQIEPTQLVSRAVRKSAADRCRVSNIGRHDEHLRSRWCFERSVLERLTPPAGKHDGVALT